MGQGPATETTDFGLNQPPAFSSDCVGAYYSGLKVQPYRLVS